MTSEGPRLGRLLQQLRKQRHWTILRLAQEAHVNKATISGIENGAETTRPTLAKLAIALGTTLEDLQQHLAGPGDPQRLRLLTLWEAILPEHRHVLLQEAERIAAASQSIAQSTGSIATRIQHIEHLEGLARRLALQEQHVTKPQALEGSPRKRRSVV